MILKQTLNFQIKFGFTLLPINVQFEDKIEKICGEEKCFHLYRVAPYVF